MNIYLKSSRTKLDGKVDMQKPVSKIYLKLPKFVIQLNPALKNIYYTDKFMSLVFFSALFPFPFTVFLFCLLSKMGVD